MWRVDAVGELRDEHFALLEEAHGVRRALADDPRAAWALLASLVSRLTQHVEREERGIFTALRDQGDFAEEVAALEGEHLTLEAAISTLDPQRGDFEAAVLALLAELAEHIEREDLGIFPVAVVTLGAAGWATVEQAHADRPTFLAEGSSA